MRRPLSCPPPTPALHLHCSDDRMSSNQVFSGAFVSRQAINLGGLNRSDANSQSDLVARARQQREEREDRRKRDSSAVKIQVRPHFRTRSRRWSVGVVAIMMTWRADDDSPAAQAFYRGRHEAARARGVLRARYDTLMANQMDDQVVLEGSKLLALFFVDLNAGDLKRAALWCRTVLGANGPGEWRSCGYRRRADGDMVADKTPWLYSLYRVDATSWSVILRQITKILFSQATTRPS